MSLVKVNMNLTWAEVGATSTGPGTYVRDAFKNALAEKVLIGAGTLLYKFNNYNSLHGSDAAAQYRPVSPWWSPFHPFRHDPGWAEKKKLAGHLGVSVREWGRLTSAIKENWNSLTYLLVITLKHDVYGFFGGFSQMAAQDAGSTSLRITQGTEKGFVPEGRGARKNLPGGATQFYIPNLRPTNITSWYAESLLTS